MALAEDRDRRADAPDERNRCYAERAPRRRDLSYQADYCYSPRFPSCAVFLAWAARSAAEPAYVSEAAQRAWGSGIAAPEPPSSSAESGHADDMAPPPREEGLFGPPEPDEAGSGRRSEQLDWISASAWADVPWDDRAEREAEELELLAVEEVEEELEPEDEERPDEALQAPKVPAALPMRRRKPPLEPIRTRGSGEWIYADPPPREPLVSRRYGITPPILLAVLGVLVVSVVVFLLATTLGGGDGRDITAAASPSAAPVDRPALPSAPAQQVTAPPSAEPTPSAEPRPRSYTVRPGDTLSAIAARRGVELRLLQCANRILNPNRISQGQVLEIPPEGFSCPPNWRKATPEPEAP